MAKEQPPVLSMKRLRKVIIHVAFIFYWVSLRDRIFAKLQHVFWSFTERLYFRGIHTPLEL